MPPTIKDNATIANSSARSTSVSRGERWAYQKWRYHDLCGCSGAMAIWPLVAGCRAVWGCARRGANWRGWVMAEKSWVNVRRDGRGVAVVTIDNAARLNVLNTPVMTALVAVVERLCADDALRAVVLRGAGDRAFVGGADIHEMTALNADSAREFITLVHRSCDVFRRLPV